ncbi:MAG: efflux RND transporter permease subunit, partial [Deltaproteobacteria bacterium]|nr:efflux RND transporter permease subunit [Deltaproteobacteria bacterium]
AIVVGENVHRHQEKGEGALGSSIRGTQEVATPVIFGVLTTVAAFLPLITAPGPMGQIFRAIGLVVVFCLFFSLVESQLVLPAHLGHMKIDDEASDEPATGDGISARWKRTQFWFAHSLQNFASKVYRPALERVLHWRYASVATAIVVLMLTMSLLALGHLKFNFFPAVEADYVTARLTMPFGTPIETTTAAAQELERVAWELKRELDAEFGGEPMVRHVYAMAGDHPSSNNGPPRLVAGLGGGSHLAEVSIELQGGDARPIKAKVVADRWREMAPPIFGAEELVFASALFSVGDPIYVKLKSANVDDLLLSSERLKARLAEYAGVIDIADSFREGKQEIRLSLLPTAEPLGLTLDDLSRQVRQAFYGEEAQRIQRGRDDVRVMVRYPRDQRRSLGDLENLRIRTPDGGEVPFYAVAQADHGRGYANIRRADRQRVINVTADVDLTVTTANEVAGDLRRNVLPALGEDFPSLSIDFGGEQREQRKTVSAVGRTYLFALVLIYVLLAIPLRSYGQPLIIMAVIPFGLVGAIAGHLLLGKGLENFGLLFGVAGLGKQAVFNMSMMSMFGVVALSGVVVNASLVLVHYINQVRDEGVALLDAVADAGVARFRPVALTSITTFAGLTPLLLEGSVSAQFLIPMAVSLAFGVVFASLISLFMVPSAYVILEDLKALFRRAEPEPVPAPGHLGAIDQATAREALDP